MDNYKASTQDRPIQISTRLAFMSYLSTAVCYACNIWSTLDPEWGPPGNSLVAISFHKITGTDSPCVAIGPMVQLLLKEVHVALCEIC